MKTFISYSREDKVTGNEFAELLRMHYVPFFLDERGVGAGQLDDTIFGALESCTKFAVLISPAALKSKWVRKEVAWAINSGRYMGDNFLPILIEPVDPPESWMDLHEKIRGWVLIDFVSDADRAERMLLEGVYKRMRHSHPYYQVGDVKIQVLRLVGGNGKTRFLDGDIICDGPTHDRDYRKYQLPEDIETSAAERLAEAEADARKRGALFVNNPQVRLTNYGFGSGNHSGGLSAVPIRLELGWTEYFHTRLTNQSRNFVLPCGHSIELKYGRDLEEFRGSGLSNPIATNMSVVTSDRKIFVATRTPKVAWNPGGDQPAVSGDGQPEDLTPEGVYDPFQTAIREGKEECLGDYNVQREHVTFFGLARTMGTQFPFLFGEIRVPLTADEVLGHGPFFPEGQRLSIDFTVESVCKWIRRLHLDHYEGKQGGVVGTTLFSLLQSLHYEYPEHWIDVMRLLKKP